jgi:hypothetical protein
MKIKDILQRDPAAHPLINQGQARISDRQNERAMQELYGELSTFVCEGQYADGIQKIVRSFIDNIGRTNQRGAWVSGFYGSGKSHLLKMLCHLWQNTEFPDGATARSLVPSIPQELNTLLRELDIAGKRAGGLLAAAGSLPSGTTDNVRTTILSILLRATGMPEQYPQARFCLWLQSQGHYNTVRSAIELAGKSFDRELNNLYVSGPIARAVIDCDPAFATGEAEAKQLIKANFPPQTSDISTQEFLRTAKDALALVSQNDRLPCTIIVLDEVQAYIGESNDRSVLITEVAEAVEKQLDSHVMIVGAGQSALTDVPLLQKLMDRFTIRIPLSDAEVETVTRKVLLQKKSSAINDVRTLLEKYSGEVSRQLQGTRIGEITEDRVVIVDDYPLLPVRWRFWEECFRQIDAAGTSSQLRSQLRIVHDAVAKLSDRPVGAVVPADELFDALAPEMVNTGVMLREINERIIQVGNTVGPLAQRICGLVFLIGKLTREAGADTGVRATKDHIADLIIDDLTGDNGKLRNNVEQTLKKLADDGVLMLVGEEYRLQTREGTEWDREFRNRQTKLNNDDAAIQFKRDQFLYSEIDKIIRSVRVVHGASKEPRQFVIHREPTPPTIDGSGIPVWIRDGWSASEKDVTDAARSAGSDSPTINLFIPRHSADDLRRLIVEADAAQQTLDTKGNPTGAEGQEARQSMNSRRARAVGDRDRLIREIVSNSKVFQGGGNEVLLSTLEDRVKMSSDDALVRMFPRFKEADSTAWPAVIKRARDGADHPFQPTGHSDATEKHGVCQQVLSTIGGGKSGADIRKTLNVSPFGWPRDAVDAALISLHCSQHITATLNGVAVPIGQLDQNKISKSDFRIEHATLSVQDRLVLRKLFQSLGITCKSGEEGIRASDFLTKMLELSRSTGGQAPLPAQPQAIEILDIQKLTGNEQLVAIKNKASDWEATIKHWHDRKDLVDRRLPQWALLVRLARHAASIEEAKPYLDEKTAVIDQRLLLESSDPASGICKGLASILRRTVQKNLADHESAFNEAKNTLEKNDVWKKLPADDQNSIKIAVGLRAPNKPEVSNDEGLAGHLDRTPLSSSQAEIDAIPGRVAQAIERAAKLLEPKIQTIALERSTLRNTAEVEAWAERQKKTLLEAVANGPVLVS